MRTEIKYCKYGLEDKVQKIFQRIGKKKTQKKKKHTKKLVVEQNKTIQKKRISPMV